ncbi:transposase [Selenomonas sp. TAMA-11512]|uniref:IS4 family transposase n=1 Tax=Selenomonas sp. TAMA-11512 TaxID=3095337 RepID=UPI0030917D51|nr:transposase [Selenomonas sp. TAMA-11512]
MHSITQTNHSENQLSDKMQYFLRRYHVSRILRSANAYKFRGVPVLDIFLAAFSSAFARRSFFMQIHLQPNTALFAKDTFYRFMNSCHIHWRRFTTLLAATIIRSTIAPLTSTDRVNVLILDDSIYHRARSKKVELLARLYDHAKKEYSYGFRMFTLCWSDGNTLLPVSHTLMSTENRKNRLCASSEKVDARTSGGKGRKLAQRKATEVMLHLLAEAKAAAIPARHVLFDTWFCSPASLLRIHKLGYEVVAMAKKTEKVHYLHEGVMQDVQAIYRKHRKHRGRSKYLLSVEATARKGNESIPVRLVFVRNRNNRKDWLVLVTTDMHLMEEEVIRIYGKRWDIEVFFKVCKSYLRLEKDCRSLSYDAMTAHVSIVFTRYMFLAVEQRECKDDRSIGELFYLSIDELSDLCYAEAVRLLVSLFAARVQERMLLDEGEVQELLQGFLAELPMLLSQNLRKCA